MGPNWPVGLSTPRRTASRWSVTWRRGGPLAMGPDASPPLRRIATRDIARGRQIKGPRGTVRRAHAHGLKPKTLAPRRRIDKSAASLRAPQGLGCPASWALATSAREFGARGRHAAGAPRPSPTAARGPMSPVASARRRLRRRPCADVRPRLRADLKTARVAQRCLGSRDLRRSHQVHRHRASHTNSWPFSSLRVWIRKDWQGRLHCCSACPGGRLPTPGPPCEVASLMAL